MTSLGVHSISLANSMVDEVGPYIKEVSGPVSEEEGNALCPLSVQIKDNKAYGVLEAWSEENIIHNKESTEGKEEGRRTRVRARSLLSFSWIQEELSRG
ncbi:hypothetical protein NDU88_009380 [Pleurodeles waltl]|uniref:Uncharacterized protein n=1 Tax=Pleurodeles waltl TaxID=8319 RepID=A0AAV7QXC6_PLEWA|nr:hypothetical protein NDU88_009380 [Pleurodeles waltl]